MNSLSTEQLSAADIRAMVGGEDRLDSRTTPKGHWQATDGRPSSLLRPARNKRFASSFVHLVGVTIASLAAVYLLLRCFEHTVLSHGQGAAARLLATGRNNPEDECTRSEKEQDSGKEPEDNEHRTLSTGLEGIPDEPGTSTALTPPAPDYAGAPWGESGAAVEGGAEAVYDEPVRELTEEQERWAQAAEWYPKGMKGAAEPKTWTGEGGRQPDAVAMGEAQGEEGVWTGEEGRYPDGVEGARGQEAMWMGEDGSHPAAMGGAPEAEAGGMGEEGWYPGAEGGTTGAEAMRMQGKGEDGGAVGGTPEAEAVQLGAHGMYRGAVGGTPKTPPWMLVEGRVDAGVGGSPETEAMPKGEDDQSSQGNELSGAGNDGSPQSSGSWRDEPIEEGYWENREVPLDTAVQMERTLENVVHHATVCWEILPYIPPLKLQRFTVTVVKTLCIQLGVHSLTPPRLEYYRDKAGQRLVTLITRALELGETYFTPRQQRELTDLLGFTRVIMTPRPPGEDLTPRKFRSKILGIMSFSAVVHWYLTGIILGMKYHLATYRELTEAFVESQTNLIAIVHDHQLARVVLDTGSRWYIERTQMVLSLTTFFNREQARHSSSVPVPSINDFASSLGRAISRAGGLMYESIHGVKHVSTGNKASVLVGRSGPNVVYSSSTEPSGVVGALPVLPGVGQPGTDGTLAARPASPKETRTQSISPFQDKHSRRVAYTSPERGHSPGTKHPSEHLPQLQTTSELAGAPEPQQPQQAVPPTLQAPLKAEYPPSSRESEVDPRTTRTTPVARYTSSGGGVPGMYGGSPTQQGAGLQQAFGESVDKPLSVPSELLRKALEVETSLQQSPDVDESSAVSRYGHRRGDAAVPAESPGLPLTRQPQQISDGWGHFPFSDRRWLPAQPPQIPAHLSEQKTETSTGYAPPRPPPGFESLFDVGKRLDLLPKTRESRSPSPQPFFPGLPETGAEHSLSFTTRFAFDSWVAPLGSSFHTSSSQRGGSASHSSLSPANSLRGSLLTSSTPTPSGIDLSGLVRGSGTLPSSLRPAESVGSPYGQPHSGMPPAFEHGPSGVTRDVDEPVQASLAVGISNYEEPQDES